MPVTPEFKEKFLKAVTGTAAEKQAKQAAITAITATDKAGFIKAAHEHIKQANGACPDGWFMCRDGGCAPSKEDCSGLGGVDGKQH